ncbi:MAG: phospholipid-binding lipoprotein MlaA [Porticoccus sp.]
MINTEDYRMKHTALLLAGVLLSGQVFSGGDPESSNESTAPALSYENSSNSSSYQSEALDQKLNLDYSIYDPWEGFNRKIFAFNDTIDTYAFKPLAKGYRFVTPDVVEEGLSRVFSNLGELVNIANDLMQGKFKQATNDTGRFLINSTVGLGGFFDVADNLGLPKNEGEDFGQTLGFYGVKEGPYLMLPIFGPSTLRDAPSRVIDQLLNPISEIDDIPARNAIYGSDGLTTRAELLKAEALFKGDKYAFYRDIYLQRRQYLVDDGKVEDDF